MVGVRQYEGGRPPPLSLSPTEQVVWHVALNGKVMVVSRPRQGYQMVCSVYGATVHVHGTGWQGMRRLCATSWHYCAILADKHCSCAGYIVPAGRSVAARILYSAAYFSSLPSLT